MTCSTTGCFCGPEFSREILGDVYFHAVLFWSFAVALFLVKLAKCLLSFPLVSKAY